MPREYADRLRQWVLAGLLGLTWCTIGCQEAIRTTLLDQRVTGGELLESIALADRTHTREASDLGIASRMIASASAQRWSDPKPDQAHREIVLWVMFLSEGGESIHRHGDFEMCVREYDDKSLAKVGEELARFRAQGDVLDRAWQGERLNSRYLFRLALRKEMKQISREIFRRKHLFVVVEVWFLSPDGESLRAVSAPIELENPK